MTVEWKDAADELRLSDLVDGTANAKQRDRYRVVLIAGRADLAISVSWSASRSRRPSTVDRSRQFVDQWVGRYRVGRARRDGAGPRRLTHGRGVEGPRGERDVDPAAAQEPGTQPGGEPVALPA